MTRFFSALRLFYTWISLAVSKLYCETMVYCETYGAFTQDPDNVINAFKRDGVVVIADVFTGEYCEQFNEDVAKHLMTLSPELRTPADWFVRTKLPPSLRSGMYQQFLSNFQPLWDVRCSEKLCRVFRDMYTHLRGKPVSDLVTSIDGMTYRPYNPSHTHRDSSRWPHIDLVDPIGSNVFKYVQGQVVMSNSSAMFRCFPGSHRHHREMLKLFGVQSTQGNFYKFPKDKLDMLDGFLNSKECFVTEVYAPVGSMILWSSALVHDATIQRKTESGTGSTRSVVYVTQIPAKECSKSVFKRLQKCVRENRSTNHTAERMFGKGDGRYSIKGRHTTLQEYIDNPESIYNVIGRPLISKPELLGPPQPY